MQELQDKPEFTAPYAPENGLGPKANPCLSSFDQNPPLGRLYTVNEVAEQLKVSPDTVVNLFQHEKGVIDLGRPASKNRRAYRILRIPEEILRRVIERRRVR